MIIDLLKKTANYGLRLVRGLKYEVKTTVRALEKEGLLSKKQAQNLIKRLLKEANMEQKAFKKFMAQEIKKELRKGKKLIKKGAKKIKKSLKNKKKGEESKKKVKKRGKKKR